MLAPAWIKPKVVINSAARVKNVSTCTGLAIPVVSPKPISAHPAAASSSASPKTRSGSTTPS